VKRMKKEGRGGVPGKPGQGRTLAGAMEGRHSVAVTKKRRISGKIKKTVRGGKRRRKNGVVVGSQKQKGERKNYCGAATPTERREGQRLGKGRGEGESEKKKEGKQRRKNH